MVELFQPGVQDCPHCLARVVIVSNGICPRCQQNARDISTVNRDRKSVWVRPTDRMPKVCHQCGTRCDRTITVKHTQAWESSDDIPKSRNILATLIGFLFGWIWYLVIRDRGGAGNTRRFESLVVRVPQCTSCSSKPIEQVAASIEDNSLKLVAHIAFVHEFEQENPGPSTC